mgnify:CR=1 FL=1
MSQNTAASATELARNLPALEHPDGSRIRALVVDDEAMLAELIGSGLRMTGWEVRSAGDGPSALAAARDARGVIVGLDALIDLGLRPRPAPAAEAPVDEGAAPGQVARTTGA